MGVSDKNPRSVLPAVRYYFQLLVVTVVVLSSTLVASLYWNDRQHHRLETIANNYHLETILYCTRIKEEIASIFATVTDGKNDLEPPSRQNQTRRTQNNSLYLIRDYIRAISRIHETHAAVTGQVAGFDHIIRKADRQLAGIKEVLQVAGDSGLKPDIEPDASTLLNSFGLSIEQLRRLHVIARDKVNSELTAANATSIHRLLLIFIAAMLLGALVVWKILGGIRHLLDEQSKSEAALRQSAIVFENASEGVVITDVEARIMAVNKAFTKITGYAEHEVLGQNPRILKSSGHDQAFYRSMWSSIMKHGEWRGEISGRRKNGEIFPKWQTISAVRNHDGELTHYVSVFSDISYIKETEEQLHHMAHHDHLTGLPNRLLFKARLEHSMQLARRGGASVAVLFLDLDHFKKINDSLGHPVGDHLLQQVAKRLLAIVREEDTVARLGGDELTLVLGALHGTGYVATAAQEILDNLSEPFELEGHEVFISASIGISIYPQDGRDTTELLKNADAAMYMAKSQGRNTYQFYSEDLTVNSCDSLSLETDLYRALEREEFILVYQPQLSLQSGCIVGVEALVRWQRPQIGLVPPSEFIPLAEENGLIEAIGLWVLRAACTQAKAWQHDGLTPIRMAVNISERQLRNNRITSEICDILEETGLDPCYLELELTESSVMKHAKEALKTLNELRELGVTIAIDDFGTGYSSLSYLKLFPVDRLKVDRSFVHDIPHDPNDVAIASAIVTLGHSLGLSVVAEGIETPAQREHLASIGCDEMQGFLFSEPGTAAELQAILPRQSRPACVND